MPNWVGSRAHNSGLSDDDAANAAAVLNEDEDDEAAAEVVVEAAVELVLDLLPVDVVALFVTKGTLFALPPTILLPFAW